MRWFWCRPPGIRSAGCCVALRPARNRDPCELDPRRRGSEGAVVWIIWRQTSVAHRADKPEPAEDLHRPRSHVITPDGGCFTSCASFNGRHLDATLRKINRECQSNRPCPNNKHIGINSSDHETSIPPALFEPEPGFISFELHSTILLFAALNLVKSSRGPAWAYSGFSPKLGVPILDTPKRL